MRRWEGDYYAYARPGDFVSIYGGGGHAGRRVRDRDGRRLSLISHACRTFCLFPPFQVTE